MLLVLQRKKCVQHHSWPYPLILQHLVIFGGLKKQNQQRLPWRQLRKATREMLTLLPSGQFGESTQKFALVHCTPISAHQYEFLSHWKAWHSHYGSAQNKGFCKPVLVYFIGLYMKTQHTLFSIFGKITRDLGLQKSHINQRRQRVVCFTDQHPQQLFKHPPAQTPLDVLFILLSMQIFNTQQYLAQLFVHLCLYLPESSSREYSQLLQRLP